MSFVSILLLNKGATKWKCLLFLSCTAKAGADRQFVRRCVEQGSLREHHGESIYFFSMFVLCMARVKCSICRHAERHSVFVYLSDWEMESGGRDDSLSLSVATAQSGSVPADRQTLFSFIKLCWFMFLNTKESRPKVPQCGAHTPCSRVLQPPCHCVLVCH